MIKTMEIDDQNFDMIVTYARRAIRKYAPEWTDENAHDPGITLIELMAWLKEMLQFYMDQMTEPLEEQFLKLLGMKPDFGKPARVIVQSLETQKWLELQERTKLSKGRFIFETDEPQIIKPIEIKDILMDDGEHRRSVYQNLSNGLSIYPFGQEAKVNTAMYIVLSEPLEMSQTEQFYFKVFDSYAVARNPVIDYESFVPLASMSWSIGNQLGDWKALEVELDETLGFIQSGLVKLKSQEKICGHMIKIELKEAHYDYAPRILDVYNRVFEVIQRDTISYDGDSQLIFDGSGLPHQQYRIAYENIYYESLKVEVLNGSDDEAIWEPWTRVPRLVDAGEEEACFYVNVAEGLLCFGDGVRGAVPRKGIRNIRITQLERSYLEQGNIEIDVLATKDNKHAFKCVSKVHGGEKYCTLEDLKNKLMKLMNEPAVCASVHDYESMLMKTQGLRLKSVKCLPLYKPKLSGYPEVLAENAVSLFVIAAGPSKLNPLNEAYKENLRRQAEKHRPITTELYILDPSYYEVHVYCEIVSQLEESKTKAFVEQLILENLDYSLGETVTKSGIYRKLRQSGTINQVKNIGLSCSRFVAKNRLGDLLIPPDGMPIISSVEIVVISDH